MKNKIQIFLVHGGNTFKTYKEYIALLKNVKLDFERYWTRRKGWKATLDKKLGKNFEVILIDMPNKMNAKYSEWKIWFEKFIPYFEQKAILIGHSLGGIFLAKYLSENKFPKKILATILVAAPYGNDKSRKINQSLGDFVLPKSLSRFQKQGGVIYLCHSTDDSSVPFSHLKKYQAALPEAQIKIFKNRGHFNQNKFPEIVRMIKDDVKRR
ncbi:MAG: hypothetical protein D4Q79_01430 [Spirochaetia bacterium]|nr:MAG: hypothetical protein D4Q79_01430 [Spirochaetia bacterium]